VVNLPPHYVLFCVLTVQGCLLYCFADLKGMQKTAGKYGVRGKPKNVSYNGMHVL